LKGFTRNKVARPEVWNAAGPGISSNVDARHNETQHRPKRAATRLLCRPGVARSGQQIAEQCLR